MTRSSSTRKKVPTTKALAQMKQDLAQKSSSGQKAAPRKCVTLGKESHASVTADWHCHGQTTVSDQVGDLGVWGSQMRLQRWILERGRSQ